MKVQTATIKDMPDIARIYEYARRKMRKEGNGSQWGDSYPEIQLLESDIKNEALFVIMDERQCGCSRKPSVVGVFAFYLGDDPTYAVIEDGKWLNEDAYGTIHRIAGGPTAKGIMSEAVRFAKSKSDNIRIDTHANNRTMQHALDKLGFEKCGIIYIEDGSPRIAYQLSK